MKNELAIKTYDIDYSFIIKNYLDQELWNKTWTLLVYKNYRITLELAGIKCQEPINIKFRIRVDTGEKSDSNIISYDLSNGNLTVLKNQINGCITQGIDYCEKWSIEDEEGYRDIDNAIREEESRLREIAEEYLDENNITLDDVREAYIDRYVSDNSKGYTYRSNYIVGRKYLPYYDLWLVFAKITENDNLYEVVSNKLQDNIKFNDVLKEIDEYLNIMNQEEDTEEYNDYIENMKENLVGV